MSRDRADRVTRLISEVLTGTGYELVDVELAQAARRSTIRVFIDHLQGVGLDDCARVTRLLGDHLDAAGDMGLQSYVLEVSSPGIDRPLKGALDFLRFRGESASVTTMAPIEGRSQHHGVIQGVEDETLVLDQPDIGITRILINDIKKAQLKRDPWEIAKGRR